MSTTIPNPTGAKNIKELLAQGKANSQPVSNLNINNNIENGGNNPTTTNTGVSMNPVSNNITGGIFGYISNKTDSYIKAINQKIAKQEFDAYIKANPTAVGTAITVLNSDGQPKLDKNGNQETVTVAGKFTDRLYRSACYAQYAANISKHFKIKRDSAKGDFIVLRLTNLDQTIKSNIKTVAEAMSTDGSTILILTPKELLKLMLLLQRTFEIYSVSEDGKTVTTVGDSILYRTQKQIKRLEEDKVNQANKSNNVAVYASIRYRERGGSQKFSLIGLVSPSITSMTLKDYTVKTAEVNKEKLSEKDSAYVEMYYAGDYSKIGINEDIKAAIDVLVEQGKDTKEARKIVHQNKQRPYDDNKEIFSMLGFGQEAYTDLFKKQSGGSASDKTRTDDDVSSLATLRDLANVVSTGLTNF